eukprot:CAMPEP_0175807234 /NCGR_PEP_ID=MMETSP0107_2-20121207/1616_1 /TAXON_ID=195067 ORGANISM="Goniomonas pacifica, Strain CCMP1869" /NCGR_SAMPLE_ID=MMETSP0107_2 /ASSEMBLY_ACC=CAM_ASM_000203 /LENGTH=194 /DNA_ID=CAMNT_0017118779 /DNA_START=78 /DNA_END=662 /DNA_ORIENTATION=+
MTAVLVDGNPHNIQAATAFFGSSNHPPGTAERAKLVGDFVTTSNVARLVNQHGISGDEIDALSIDMDGMDYWILSALVPAVVHPRVIVVEIQEQWGPTEPLTRPYSDTFSTNNVAFFGCSIGAYVKWGKANGYRLVGCMKEGYNAFFLRNDVGVAAFPEYDAEGCFAHWRNDPGYASKMQQRAEEARSVEWVRV